jgi:hypothetical protein
MTHASAQIAAQPHFGQPLNLPQRPVSWICAFGLLGVAVFLAHTGLHGLYSPSVANVLTAAFLFIAWLNWQAVARATEAYRISDRVRGRTVMALAATLAAGEAWLTHHGFLALSAGDGAPLASTTSWAFAAALASLNLWAKYGFVTPIVTQNVDRTTPMVTALEGPAEPAEDYLESRLRRNEQLGDRDREAIAASTRTVSERLHRAAGRIRTRLYRARQRLHLTS